MSTTVHRSHSDWMIQERKEVAPNERKLRERQPPMCDAQRACHRTRAGRGVVGRLMKGKAGKL